MIENSIKQSSNDQLNGNKNLVTAMRLLKDAEQINQNGSKTASEQIKSEESKATDFDLIYLDDSDFSARSQNSQVSSEIGYGDIIDLNDFSENEDVDYKSTEDDKQENISSDKENLRDEKYSSKISRNDSNSLTTASGSNEGDPNHTSDANLFNF